MHEPESNETNRDESPSLSSERSESSPPRIWATPQWYIRVLRDLAAEFEQRMESAARHGLDKYTRGRNMQTRENLKYAADYLEHLTERSESRASIPSEASVCACGNGWTFDFESKRVYCRHCEAAK